MDLESVREHKIPILIVVAMILGVFSYAPMGLPVFAWIWPAILIYALRRLPLKRAMWVAIVAIAVPMLIAHSEAVGGSGSGRFALGDFLVCALIVLIVVLLNCLPFIMDRVAFGKMGKYEQMFVLPLTWAFATIVCGLLQWGDMISIAYSQAKFIWFTQSLSLIGMFGMVFVIGWFASSVNLFIDEYLSDKKIDWPSTICAFVVVGLVIFGGVRLAVVNDSDTMTVMCANGHNNLKDGLDDYEHNLQVFDEAYDKALGLKVDMLVFFEESCTVVEGDIVKFENHIGERVRAGGIMTLFTTKETKDGVTHNSCELFTKDGLQWKYYKTKLVPLSDNDAVAGDGTIHFTDTEYGRLTSVICMDLEFPMYVNRIDPDADMLISPSWDWKGLEGWHTRNTSFRAIENGVSFLRCTMNGTIGSYDNCGRAVDSMDYFPTTTDDTPVVKVCTQGTWTFYGHYGKIVDWMFIIAFLAFAAVELYLRVFRDRTILNQN